MWKRALYFLFKMGKALWYIASPRSLKTFYDWADKVDYVDKLIVKNHMHHVAQEIAMKFFFEGDYDYFIISSDDIQGKPSYLKQLIKDEEEHGFPVVSGWNLRYGTKTSNVTLDPIKNIETPSRVSGKSYNWVLADDIIKGRLGYPFFNAWFVGLPLTLIRREILSKIPLTPFLLQRDGYCITPETKKKGRGKMFDVQFAVNCAHNRIPITIDARVQLRGIRKAVEDGRDRLQVGKNPRVKFIKASA